MDIEKIKALLSYDASTGELIWRPRTSGRGHESFNARFAGQLAGWVDGEGYLCVTIQGRRFAAHRVCWAIHHGAWPRQTIDHINGNKMDNRIGNLRDVPNAENNKNRPMQANNTSGHTGVYWHKLKQRWRAKVKIDGRWRELGNFTDLADAVAARRAAERRHGFTARHGRASPA